MTLSFVELGDELYIRSVNAVAAHAGRISVDGVEQEVAFEETSEHADALGAAYQEKDGKETR